jgi:hypothetical protein
MSGENAGRGRRLFTTGLKAPTTSACSSSSEWRLYTAAVIRLALCVRACVRMCVCVCVRARARVRQGRVRRLCSGRRCTTARLPGRPPAAANAAAPAARTQPGAHHTRVAAWPQRSTPVVLLVKCDHRIAHVDAARHGLRQQRVQVACKEWKHRLGVLLS